jgi:hypothetical protein
VVGFPCRDHHRRTVDVVDPGSIDTDAAGLPSSVSPQKTDRETLDAAYRSLT